MPADGGRVAGGPADKGRLEEAAEEHFLAQSGQEGDDRHFCHGPSSKQRDEHFVGHAADIGKGPDRPPQAQQGDGQRRQGQERTDRESNGIPAKRLQGGLVEEPAQPRRHEDQGPLEEGGDQGEVPRRQGIVVHDVKDKG